MTARNSQQSETDVAAAAAGHNAGNDGHYSPRREIYQKIGRLDNRQVQAEAKA